MGDDVEGDLVGIDLPLEVGPPFREGLDLLLQLDDPLGPTAGDGLVTGGDDGL